MNIFFLSLVIEECVKFYFNKHVVKMILEYTQLLCTSYWCLDPETASSIEIKIPNDKLPSGFEIRKLYKKTHFNHPCAVWTRKHKNNWLFVLKLAKALCDEWRYRFSHPDSKKHTCEYFLEALDVLGPPKGLDESKIEPDILNIHGLSLPLPQCFGGAVDPIQPDNETTTYYTTQAYRKYYQSDSKLTLRNWGNRNKPSWFIEEEKQIEKKIKVTIK